MGQLRDRMMHDLEFAGYVPKTQLVYLNAIRDFAAHHRRSPTLLGPDDVRAWVDGNRPTKTVWRSSVAVQRAAAHAPGSSSSIAFAG